jgi:WD40 repeat protein
VAAATYFGPVQLWDVASGKHLWTGSIDFGNSASLGMLADGSLVIAVDTDTHIRAYNRQGMVAYSADSGLLEPFGLGLSADGKKFAVGGMDGTLVLYDSATGKRLSQSENSGNTIWGVVMAPAGTRVIAEEEDDGYRMETVAIGYWDTAGRELKKLAVDPKTVIGWGKNAQQLLLLRQQSPGLITVDTVE